MEKRIFSLLAFVSVLVLSGCVVRTYPLTRDRVDQDLSGNRGYLQGQAPAGEERPRKETRRTQIIEIELSSPIKFDTKKKAKPVSVPVVSEPVESDGNRGYITQNQIPEVEPIAPKYETYTVKKGDTLQKISKKYYGTTKKWAKIYEANRDTMTGPDKIYPGKVLNIPSLPEMKSSSAPVQENLK
jgi:nucleoid-associated protein YgaU